MWASGIYGIVEYGARRRQLVCVGFGARLRQHRRCYRLWKRKYPDEASARGVPFTGIENARPAAKAIGDMLAQLRKELPCHPLGFMEFEMPISLKVTHRVDAID